MWCPPPARRRSPPGRRGWWPRRRWRPLRARAARLRPGPGRADVVPVRVPAAESLPHPTPRPRVAPESAGVGAQRLEVGDHELAPPRRDPTEAAERGERLVHGLARRAGPAGELLLRQRQRDLHPALARAAVAVAELDEAAGDTSDHAVGV